MSGKSMVEAAPGKHILHFALPVPAGSLLRQLYNTQVTRTVGSNDFYAPKTIAEEFRKLYDLRETHEILH